MARLAIWILLAASSALAQDNYFPLHVGNQWVYSVTGAGAAQPVVVEVTGTQEFNGLTYYMTSGFALNPVYLRLSAEGVLYAYDPETKAEVPWVMFSAAEGETYSTAIDSCNNRATLVSRSSKTDLRIGSFSNLAKISYPPGLCADSGITEEYYLPYIGLVKRTRTTFAGPRTVELIYSRIGGVTVVSAPEVSFTLTVDRPFYVVSSLQPGLPAPIVARLTLRNTTSAPLSLRYSDGQEFDFILKNAKGEIVYRWSADKGFTLALRAEEFTGERNRVVTIPLVDSKGGSLPPGSYTLEAFLTALPPASFRAQIGIELR